MNKDSNKQEIKKWTKIIIIAAIAYLIVNNISIVGNTIGFFISIISPFVIGACLAFILNLPMTFFENKLGKFKTKKGKKLNKNFVRIISLLLAFVVIIFIIALIVNLIVPEIVNIIKLLIENFPTYAERIKEFATTITEDYSEINEVIKDININNKEFQNQVKTFATNFLSKSVSVVGNIINSVINFIVAIVFSVYILTSKDKLKNQFKKLLYAYLEKGKAERIMDLGRTSRNIFRKFITGQCLEATILGALSIIGMLILQVPYAVPIGVLIGVTALIPIVGAFIGIIIGAVLILAAEPLKVITFIIYILILQQIEGNLIYPKVVGSSVGLPGIWVLVAVAIGGDLFGIIGMLLGLPIASILYTILRDDVNKRLSEK